MNPTISGLLAVLLYLVGTGLQFTSKGDNKRIVTGIGLAAVLFHGVTSYLGFYTDVGIDLGLYPMLLS